MGIFRKDNVRQPTVRLFFASDLHGSNVAFRKMLNAVKAYEVDALICGGDVAGKRLYPVVDHGDATHTIQRNGSDERLQAGDELDAAREQLADAGAYTVDVDPDEAAAMAADHERMERVFVEKVRERLAAWVALAEERLAGTDTAIYVTGGNDDSDEMLEPLRNGGSSRLIACEGRVVDVCGYPMASLGWSNETPWNTPRETDEGSLAAMIDDAIDGLGGGFERAIFNFHVPPKDSSLDTCPRLDTSVWPPAPVMHGGEVEVFGAGSSAVAEAIQRHQPMLSLHGHIHESANAVRLGRTVAINPGSDYQDGCLRGAIVCLRGDKVADYQLTRG
jgi:Icc-related predicted phosphoesterase